jgi:hypothetical protein
LKYATADILCRSAIKGVKVGLEQFSIALEHLSKLIQKPNFVVVPPHDQISQEDGPQVGILGRD